MDVERKWYCTCSGAPVELASLAPAEEDETEPGCERCGATPSSDPHRHLFYRDVTPGEG